MHKAHSGIPLIGLDVGGTKVAAYLAVDDTIMNEIRLDTDISSNQATADCIIRTINQVLGGTGFRLDDVGAIGVGIPGMITGGVVDLAVNLNLHGYPLGPVLQKHFLKPVVIENDVRMAAMGVYDQISQIEPIQSMVYLSIGTGIAAGFILNGRLYRGVSGMAGEIGHVSLTDGIHGPLCNCGQRGCYERFTAGPALVDQAQLALKNGDLSNLGDEPVLTGETIFAAYRAGDGLARRIVNDQVAKITLAMRWLMMVYDAEVLILGGGIANQGDILLPAIQKYFEPYRQSSPLAAHMFAKHKFRILSPDAKPPGWGAVVLAREIV